MFLFNPVSRIRYSAAMLPACIAMLTIFTGSALAVVSPTVTTLTLLPANPVVGNPVLLTASVTTAGANITSNGLVSFYDNPANTLNPSINSLIGTVEVNGAAKARLRFVPGVGPHQLIAVFQPTTTLSGSSSNLASPVAFTIAGKKTYVTASKLTAASSAGFYGLLDILTFYGSPAPNGKLTLTDTTNGTVSKAIPVVATTQGFAPTVSSSSGSTHAVGVQISATGDFNEDGVPDLAVSNLFDGNVGILIGNGNGTFQPAVTYTTSAGPYGIGVGDFNGDGHQDLAVTNVGAGTVSILTGDGTGVFTAQTPVAVGYQPYEITVGDFNNDGALDLAVTNFGANNTTPGQIVVLLNNGRGGFPVAKQVVTPVGLDPIALVTGNFGVDGNLGLVVANSYEGSVGLLLGNGDGSFQPQVVYSTNTGSQTQGNNGSIPYAAAVGDFNNDGFPDVVVATLNSSSVTILQNTGAGTFTVQPPIATDLNPISVAAFNADGSGNASIAVATYGANTIDILTNDGSGTFPASSLTSIPSTPGAAGVYYGLTIADLNGDGKPDIATTNFNGTGFGIQLGTQTVAAFTTVKGTFTGTLEADYIPAAGDAYQKTASSVTLPAASATKKK
ncbi:FG-GAP repeat domain-containing protein [Granulicella arctica]|uniref:FG-GAP repeat domain-containing protein n=1 Tax=Granulicella arctica TaxID=940613 RepID=UPI0021DFC1CC|nr:VCBS repeat-containing protein [Granulicella arctica]